MHSKSRQHGLFLATDGLAELRTRDSRARACVVRVDAGVVLGRSRRRAGGAYTDVWSLFNAREQLDARALVDGMRFTDPLSFQCLARELKQAFDAHDHDGGSI